MNTRESEGIENRWERRAELSAESPGRKTRHHRKIALSRTHLFSIPSSWPFTPFFSFPSRSPGASSAFHLPPLRTDSSVRQRIYKSVFRRFPLFHLGHWTRLSTSQLDTHARSTFRKTRDLSLGAETTAFLPSNGESIRRVNFER